MKKARRSPARSAIAADSMDTPASSGIARTDPKRERTPAVSREDAPCPNPQRAPQSRPSSKPSCVSFAKLGNERRKIEADYDRLRGSLDEAAPGEGRDPGRQAHGVPGHIVAEAIQLRGDRRFKGEKFAAELRDKLPDTISTSVKVEEVE